MDRLVGEKMCLLAHTARGRADAGEAFRLVTEPDWGHRLSAVDKQCRSYQARQAGATDSPVNQGLPEALVNAREAVNPPILAPNGLARPESKPQIPQPVFRPKFSVALLTFDGMCPRLPCSAPVCRLLVDDTLPISRCECLLLSLLLRLLRGAS